MLLRLAPSEVRGDDGDQLRLWGGPSAADERAARTVTRLTGLVGDGGVLVPAWRGGRLPSDRYGWVPASTTDLTDADDTAQRLRPNLSGPWPGSLPAPSPAVVLPDVQRAVVADGQGRPVRVSGRGELSAAPASLAIGDRAAAADHRMGRPVAARRAVVGARPPSAPGPLPGRDRRRRRPPRPGRAPHLVGRRLLRLTGPPTRRAANIWARSFPRALLGSEISDSWKEARPDRCSPTRCARRPPRSSARRSSAAFASLVGTTGEE